MVYEYSAEEPLNREPALRDLISNFITDSNGYDRNHGPILHLSAETHHLTIDGLVHEPLTLTLPDLESLPQHTVICALQCAGNRRHTMRTELKEVQGIDWFDGAVMNCKWRGPRLRDVLLKAGLDVDKPEWDDVHVALASEQNPTQEAAWYGGSIRLERAMDEDADVILALEMNDTPLTPAHGYPVRAITPGIAGARSVKWLDRITVQKVESSNFYQQHDYKILPPEVDSSQAAQDYWHRVPALQDMPINSVIGLPSNGDTVKRDESGAIDVKGYALPSGKDGPVVRVEISADGGETWQDADLPDNEENAEDGVSLRWAWCLWHARVKVDKGTGKTLLSRATDRGGNVQVRMPEWNLRGVAYNGYGDVKDLEIQ
ncbi:sulfite oxidase-like protein [Saccharata proteae CBS 121410]|uniref:Sulfite oxidase-like protein n=1 Tax=Saccharata proteae CBS 121410 TaxID=1314787 RepID=A0A9P4I2M0_9PEZI|nr:sulfite oxidase-like protein [Saccharata proteae CBS 121410]